ncbi:hypothetical protein AMECASPLE_035244 [Ameca splendens]|uniref:Uncharacterized protein n=1 Tax=Ameca splendens TaxID=208324 RepID=A0ABV0ZU95_9TELE
MQHCNNLNKSLEQAAVARLLGRNRSFKDQQDFYFYMFFLSVFTDRTSIEHNRTLRCLTSPPLLSADVMEGTMSLPEHTHSTCSYLVSAATKPQQLPPPSMLQEVFSEGPHAYLENTGKRTKKVNVRCAIRAVMDNKPFFFAFVFF